MEPNSEWQISLHSHNTLLISHKPISFGQIWGPDVICICGSNRNAAIFSVLLATRPSSLSPLVFQYPHSHISYSMAWLCDRSLQVNNGNERQPSASNQKSLLFKACLHSARVIKGKKAAQMRELTARQCEAAHILSSHLSLVKLITVQSDFDFVCTVVSQVSVQRHH